MREILPAIAAVSKLCGQQKLRGSAACRPTAHCLTVSCPQGTLLYHTMTGQLLLLESGETWQSCREALLAGWFLVPEDYDENKQARDLRTLARALKPRSGDITSFTVLTTTDCNARCFYCYEMGCARIPMSEQVAHDVAEYIGKSCGGKPVKLHWFGGEPLFNRLAIDVITEDLRQRGITFSSSMISNGYFLDEETARTANERWNLRRIQITLDGTREVYNRIKAYVNSDCPDPFERVMHNIGHALEHHICVDIRLNMDAANAEDLFALADELGKQFGERKGITVSGALLRNYTGSVRSFSTPKLAADTCNALESRLGEWGLFYQEELPSLLKANRCMADNDASDVILPDGKLDRCEHFSATDFVGDVYSGRQNTKLMRAWKETVDLTSCRSCLLYPQCFYLKRCQGFKDGCDEANRLLAIHRLERQVLSAFRDWQAKQREEKP